MARIAINIVTHNHAGLIGNCLEAVFSQTFKDFHVTVLDNASTDGTREILRAWEERGVRVIERSENTYFSDAHNFLIRETVSEFVLTLNPDVLMTETYLEQVVHAFALSERIGSVNGKLLSLEPEALSLDVLRSAPPDDMLIDGAGLMMFPSRRPYLRGNREIHTVACRRPAYIFGVDAACGAYRRAMLEDVAIDGEYFDTDFVIYREDVDLAWRALLLGWDSYYVPSAIGYHVRGFRLGKGRHKMPSELKRHSVKNGWLLLLKNDNLRSIVRYAPEVLLYQAKVMGGIMTIEWSSFGAIVDTIRLLPRIWRKRQVIQGKRARTPEEMEAWFEETVGQV